MSHICKHTIDYKRSCFIHLLHYHLAKCLQAHEMDMRRLLNVQVVLNSWHTIHFYPFTLPLRKTLAYKLGPVQLCDPMDYSPPVSSVHGILQKRTLEWVAISFSKGSSHLRDWTWVSDLEGRFCTTGPPWKPINYTATGWTLAPSLIFVSTAICLCILTLHSFLCFLKVLFFSHRLCHTNFVCSFSSL